MLKNWCLWTVVLYKALESPLDCKEDKPVSPNRINHEYSLEAEAEAPILWPPDAKSRLIVKTLMLGKIEGRRRRRWKRMRWLDCITESMDWVWASSGRQWRTRKPGALQCTGLQSQTWLSYWTPANGSLLHWPWTLQQLLCICQFLWFHHVLASLCSLSFCHTALFLNMSSSLCFVTFTFAVSSSGNLFLFQLYLAGHFLANKSQLKSQPSENFPRLANQCSSISLFQAIVFRGFNLWN